MNNQIEAHEAYYLILPLIFAEGNSLEIFIFFYYFFELGFDGRLFVQRFCWYKHIDRLLMNLLMIFILFLANFLCSSEKRLPPFVSSFSGQYAVCLLVVLLTT